MDGVSSGSVPLTKCAAIHTCFPWCLFTALLCRLIYADSLRPIVSLVFSFLMARAGRHRRMVFEVRVLMHFKRDLTHAACAPLGGEKCWKKALFSPRHPDSALWSTLLSLHLSFHLHLKSVSQLLARLCSHQQWGKHSNASRKYVQF